ncbi:hypothetical protein P5673_002752, partial [Acropora cervicornis]
LVIALVAQSWEKTSLTACVNGSISLRGDDWNRFADKLSFQTRHKDSHWSMIGFCSSTQGCTTLTPVLKDGTKLWIGSDRTLFVNHTAGNLRNATQQMQFLLVDTDSGRRIWTRLGADLNLSQVVLELFPMKDVVEVYFLDTNRTQFAQIHSNNGASLTSESSSMTAYWNRVTIERGSLIFPKINEADNGTTILLQALLNSKQTRLEALSTKTMRIFVCNSSESTSSSSTPGLIITTKPTKTSVDPAWHKQTLAIVISLALVKVIITFIIFAIQKMNHRHSESSVIPQ